MTRIYEELFIIRPDATDEEIDPFLEQIKSTITDGGNGTVDKLDKWGVRKLAYRVKKRNEGIYVLIQFTASPEVVKEVERRMRVSDLILKFINVRIDEKLKKIEKRKKIREKRALRKPPPMLPAVPSAAMPALPGGELPAHAMPGAPKPGPAAPVAAPAAEPAVTEALPAVVAATPVTEPPTVS
jgi:small subunit ribosomal protein S6